MSLFCMTLLAGCGENPPSLEDRAAEISVDATSYTGVIEAFELNIYQDGTHKIRTEEGELIVIQSPKINLNNYIGKKVTIQGSMQDLIDSKSKVFTVEKIDLEGEAGAGGFQEYENKGLGFRFEYPEAWELFDDASGVTLRGNGVNWVAIDIFNTDAKLDEFVSAHEIEDGTSVTIGSQRSLRYIESSEIRLYVPNTSKGKIYKIIFHDEGDDRDTQKKSFYSFLESFTVLLGQSKEGEKCGGTENLTCPEEFRCELESGEEDAEGVCIPVDEKTPEADCPFVPAPAGCRDYEPKSVNKDGCPTSYVCLDKPGKEPEIKSSDDALEESVRESAEDPAGGEQVSSTFIKYQGKILPEGAVLEQLEVVEEQHLAAAAYSLEDIRYRALFEFIRSADEYNFIRKALFVAGEERDWVLTEGKDIPFEFDKKVFQVSDGDNQPQTISKDMRLYENSHRDFSLQYPKNWYYRSFGPIENTIWTVGFSEKPLDHISDAIISVVLLEDPSMGKKEAKGSLYLVEIARDEDSHFLVEGSLDKKEVIDAMAETITQN